MTAIGFADASVGLLGSDGGAIFRTSDTGRSWITVRVGDQSGPITCVGFADSLNGWAIADAIDNVLHSTDGGLTWQVALLENSSRFRWLHFTSPADGWLMNCFAMWRTRDSGVTWDSVSAFPASSCPFAAFFLDSLHGWYGTDIPASSIASTSDGGVTWNSHPLAETEVAVRGLWFADTLRGWMSSVTYREVEGSVTPQIQYTTDGGITWSVQYTDTLIPLEGIAFLDGTHGCVAASGGILQTGDGGQTWRRTANVGDICMSAVTPAGTSGFAAAGEGGLVLYSSTTSSSWRQASNGLAVPWAAVAARDPNHAWAAGGAPLFERATEGRTGSTFRSLRNVAPWTWCVWTACPFGLHFPEPISSGVTCITPWTEA